MPTAHATTTTTCVYFSVELPNGIKLHKWQVFSVFFFNFLVQGDCNQSLSLEKVVSLAGGNVVELILNWANGIFFKMNGCLFQFVNRKRWFGNLRVQRCRDTNNSWFGTVQATSLQTKMQQTIGGNFWIAPRKPWQISNAQKISPRLF